MRRRDFILSFAVMAIARPIVTRAQQSAMPVIGFVNGQNPTVFADYVNAFHQGIGEMNYVEGQNVAIAYAWAEGQNLSYVRSSMTWSAVEWMCW